jgi:hypothetical protein
LVDHGVVTDLRLLLGFYAMFWQMDKVFSLDFPRPVPALLDLIAFLFFDVRKIIKLDCVSGALASFQDCFRMDVPLSCCCYAHNGSPRNQWDM